MSANFGRPRFAIFHSWHLARATPTPRNGGDNAALYGLAGSVTAQPLDPLVNVMCDIAQVSIDVDRLWKSRGRWSAPIRPMSHGDR